jgi:hypothetical protein
MYAVKATTINKDAIEAPEKIVRSKKTPRMNMHHNCLLCINMLLLPLFH